MKSCEADDLRHNLHHHITPYALESEFGKKNQNKEKKSEIRINLGTDRVHIKGI